MEFIPLTWSFNKKGTLRCKGTIGGVRQNNVPIVKYITINPGSTLILEFGSVLSAQDKNNFEDEFDASNASVSIVNKKILILRNPVINPENNPQDVKSSIDPYGTPTSFFQSLYLNSKEFLNGGPYNSMILKHQDINKAFVSDSIRLSGNKREDHYRRIYWDIEVVTPRKEFVYSKYIDNHVIAISIIFTYKDQIKKYFIYWGTYTIMNKDFISIRFSNEAGVISKFFELLDELKPDRMYTFNGDSFDVPYLIERCKLHNIKPNNIKFMRKRIKGRFQWETVNVMKIRGVEQLDLIRFFLKFYPGMNNYKLNTLAQVFLNEGKTDLNIEDMFRYFWTQDPKGMELLSLYSVQDSMLLQKLNITLGIDNIMETICNYCGVLYEDVIDSSMSNLIDKFAYMVDPGSFFNTGSSESVVHSNIEINKLYRDVIEYDYTDHYSMTMSLYSDDYNFIITERSARLPRIFIPLIYWSKYFSGRPDNTEIKDLLSDSGIIEITANNFKSLTMKHDDLLIMLNKFDYLLQLGKISYAAKTFDGRIIIMGTSKVLKPKFELCKDYLNQVLQYIFHMIDIKPEIPDIDNPKMLVLTAKIKNIDEYPNGSEKYILASQYGLPISTWVNIKYYMTVQGPIIEELITEDMIIDADYYNRELVATSKLLKYRK